MLSAVVDQLRGTDGRSSPPVFQINIVREFVYDKGAVLIASAIEEGCSVCPENHCHSTNTKEGMSRCKSDVVNISAIVARDAPPLPSFMSCRCPRNLQEIVLPRCHIGDEGACALAHAISISCASLKTLDLSFNNIAGTGATCLANCTVMHRRPQEPPYYLGLFGDGGCSIESLGLSSNPITSVGASALASALKGYRLKCESQAKELCREAPTNSSQEANGAAGFCSLKYLHLSGCKLKDEDAQMLGNALLPHVADLDDNGEAEPASSATNNLMVFNLNGNHITTRGMESLYSVIHHYPDHKSRRKSNARNDDSGLPCLQSLYSKSNHTIDLGVIVDYGTRDYNYGNFFDQEEDEQLLVSMKHYEMTGIKPKGVQIEQLKALMIHKCFLKEKMMNDLHINRECAIALEGASIEKRRQILCSSARKKINLVLEEKLHSHIITLPRRQDEYGKYLDECDSLGLSLYPVRVCYEVSSIGKHFTSLELNIFPQVFSWINRHVHQPIRVAMLFGILCENPAVCGFHYVDAAKKSYFPSGN